MNQTTKTTAELIREMDEQNRAEFQGNKAPNTKGFKKKDLGQEIYQVNRKQLNEKENGKQYLFLGLKKGNRFYSVYVNRDSLISQLNTVAIGDYIINPLLQKFGRSYTLDTMPEEIKAADQVLAEIPTFSLEAKIWDLDIKGPFINLVLATTEKNNLTTVEIRNMKNQARNARRAGDKAEFLRINKAIDLGYKETYFYKRASLPYTTSLRLVNDIKEAYKAEGKTATAEQILGSVKSYTFKKYSGECNISGIIEQNGKYQNYRIRSINPIEEWETPEYLKMQLDMSDNDEEYIENHILGTKFEQYLTAEETTSVTDEDEGKREIRHEISNLTSKWRKAETEAERQKILAQIAKKERFLNGITSTQYEAEQNARIDQDFIIPSLADMIEDGFKATYQENMTVEILNHGKAVSAYPVGAAI